MKRKLQRTALKLACRMVVEVAFPPIYKLIEVLYTTPTLTFDYVWYNPCDPIWREERDGRCKYAVTVCSSILTFLA